MEGIKQLDKLREIGLPDETSSISLTFRNHSASRRRGYHSYQCDIVLHQHCLAGALVLAPVIALVKWGCPLRIPRPFNDVCWATHVPDIGAGDCGNTQPSGDLCACIGMAAFSTDVVAFSTDVHDAVQVKGPSVLCPSTFGKGAQGNNQQRSNTTRYLPPVAQP